MNIESVSPRRCRCPVFCLDSESTATAGEQGAVATSSRARGCGVPVLRADSRVATSRGHGGCSRRLTHGTPRCTTLPIPAFMRRCWQPSVNDRVPCEGHGAVAIRKTPGLRRSGMSVGQEHESAPRRRSTGGLARERIPGIKADSPFSTKRPNE